MVLQFAGLHTLRYKYFTAQNELRLSTELPVDLMVVNPHCLCRLYDFSFVEAMTEIKNLKLEILNIPAS
jgi:hypothetical protein